MEQHEVLSYSKRKQKGRTAVQIIDILHQDKGNSMEKGKGVSETGIASTEHMISEGIQK